MLEALRYHVLLILVVCLPLLSYGQSLAFDILDGKDKVSVPFEIVQGFIVIDLKLHNSLPAAFIFDTGAENIILFHREIASLLGLKSAKTVEVQGPDLKHRIDAYICRDVYLAVENLANVKRDIIVLERDILELDKITGRDIKGLIGTSFFKGLIVEIDYKKNRLNIYDSRSVKKRIFKKYQSVPVSFKQTKAYVDCNIQFSPSVYQRANLLIDTGAGLSILLYDKQEEMEDNNYEIPTGELGNVVGGSLMGYLGKLHSVEIANFSFNNLISNLIQNDSLVEANNQVKKNGIIGNVILSRFNIIFDFLNNKLYFKPHKNYNDPFEFDKSGLEIFAIGQEHNIYLINRIVRNSPAYFSGIRKGDILRKINGVRVKWKDLNEITTYMSRKNGTRIDVELERNQQIIKKHFYLFEYVEPIEKNMKYIWFMPSESPYMIY